MLATARLAALYAEANDPRAAGLADRAAAELAGRPVGNAAVQALVRRDLDRATTLLNARR